MAQLGAARLLALGAAALSCAGAAGLRAGERPAAGVPRTRLPGGGSLPMSGLGCGRGWPKALEYLRLGGRLLDDSSHRHRHRAVGRAVREAGAEGVRREEAFVTVKIDPEWFGRENSTLWLRRALGDLGLEYVDMVMLHFAGKGGHNPPEAFQGCATWAECRAETWLALSRARDAGLVRDLGVSNFGPRQIQGLTDLGAAPVAVAQLEYHPWIPEVHRSTVAFCQQRGIAVQAYGSMGSTPKKDEFLTDERLRGIASGHNRSVGQVLLRWAVQRGVHVIPGSSQPDHMAENMDVFGWRLAEGEMALLGSIPEQERRVQYKNKGWHQPDAIL